MNSTVLAVMLVPITLIFVASAYNFLYLVALLGVLGHINHGDTFSYILRLVTLKPDAAGELVHPAGKAAHALVASRFRRGLGMTLFAIAAMVAALGLLWLGEANGWWTLESKPGN